MRFHWSEGVDVRKGRKITLVALNLLVLWPVSQRAIVVNYAKINGDYGMPLTIDVVFPLGSLAAENNILLF